MRGAQRPIKSPIPDVLDGRNESVEQLLTVDLWLVIPDDAPDGFKPIECDTEGQARFRAETLAERLCGHREEDVTVWVCEGDGTIRFGVTWTWGAPE